MDATAASPERPSCSKTLFSNSKSGYDELDALSSNFDGSWHPTTSNSSSDDFPVNVSRSLEESPQKCKASRKRKLNREQWKREKAKWRRNAGRQYISDKTSKTVQAASLGPPCTCTNKCYSKLLGEQEIIFHSFWDLEDFTAQNTKLMASLKMTPKERAYPKKTKSRTSTRAVTFLYHVQVHGTEISICKQAFLNVHVLHNHAGRVRNLQNQMKNGLTVPKKDGRGKHAKHQHKFSDEAVQGVRLFINAIPKYSSHYSRQQNPNKVYFDYDGTISSLVQDQYSTYCKENNIPAVSKDKFTKIFNNEFNIGFKLPRSDTCAKCDSYQIIANNPELLSSEEISEKKLQHELHLRKADSGQKLIADLTTLAKENPQHYHVMAMDMQQTFPTPKLSVSIAFYKRKIWTYNYGIHDSGSGKGYMFLWNESEGGRGSDEVTSCLIKYLEIANPQAKQLHIITENCKGQAKNWAIIALERSLVATKRFEAVEHSYPVVGHTRLPCDRDFGRIEKYAKTRRPIVYTPEEWEDVVSSAGPKNFVVTKMKRQDFKSKDDLKSLLSKPTKFENGKALHFSDAAQFHCNSRNPFQLGVKYCYSTLGPLNFAIIRTKARGRLAEPDPFQLPMKYRNPIPINQKKLDDVISLLPFILSANHSFFKMLSSKCEENSMEREELS